MQFHSLPPGLCEGSEKLTPVALPDLLKACRCIKCNAIGPSFVVCDSGHVLCHDCSKTGNRLLTVYCPGCHRSVRSFYAGLPVQMFERLQVKCACGDVDKLVNLRRESHAQFCISPESANHKDIVLTAQRFRVYEVNAKDVPATDKNGYHTSDRNCDEDGKAQSLETSRHASSRALLKEKKHVNQIERIQQELASVLQMVATMMDRVDSLKSQTEMDAGDATNDAKASHSVKTNDSKSNYSRLICSNSNNKDSKNNNTGINSNNNDNNNNINSNNNNINNKHTTTNNNNNNNNNSEHNKNYSSDRNNNNTKNTSDDNQIDHSSIASSDRSHNDDYIKNLANVAENSSSLINVTGKSISRDCNNSTNNSAKDSNGIRSTGGPSESPHRENVQQQQQPEEQRVTTQRKETTVNVVRLASIACAPTSLAVVANLSFDLGQIYRKYRTLYSFVESDPVENTIAGIHFSTRITMDLLNNHDYVGFFTIPKLDKSGSFTYPLQRQIIFTVYNQHGDVFHTRVYKTFKVCEYLKGFARCDKELNGGIGWSDFVTAESAYRNCLRQDGKVAFSIEVAPLE